MLSWEDVTSTSFVLYPKYEKTKTSFIEALIEYLPSKSDELPIAVPLITTLTPSKGVLESFSIIVPLTNISWLNEKMRMLKT